MCVCERICWKASKSEVKGCRPSIDSPRNYKLFTSQTTTNFLHFHWNTSVSVTHFTDDDVLDTWFSSAVFPFSIFGWPDQVIFNQSLQINLLLISYFNYFIFYKLN